MTDGTSSVSFLRLPRQVLMKHPSVQHFGKLSFAVEDVYYLECRFLIDGF